MWHFLTLGVFWKTNCQTLVYFMIQLNEKYKSVTRKSKSYFSPTQVSKLYFSERKICYNKTKSIWHVSRVDTKVRSSKRNEVARDKSAGHITFPSSQCSENITHLWDLISFKKLFWNFAINYLYFETKKYFWILASLLWK